MKELIEEWLEKNKNKKNISFDSCIIIQKKSGIGKTYKINKICDELKLNTIHFTPSNVNNSYDFEDLLQKKMPPWVCTAGRTYFAMDTGNERFFGWCFYW